MTNAAPIADILEVTLATTIERVSVTPGDRLLVSASVAAAIAFGDNTTTPSLTPQVMALGTLTSDDVFLNNETVIIGGITYTFKTTLTVPAVPYEVLIGANQTASHLNLKSAINRLRSSEGTTFATGTTEHPNVWAITANGTTTVIRAKRSGTVGNTITTTETCGHAAWGAATLASGAGEYGQIYLGTAAVAREFIVPSRVAVPFAGTPQQSRQVTTLSAIAGGAGTLTIIKLG